MIMERTQFIGEMREAIKNDDLKKVQELLQEDKDKLNLVLPIGSWLNLAITCQAVDIMEYLLDQGIDQQILIASTKGNSLSNAAAVGTPELLKYLLSRGIKLICECNDSNPIFSSIRGNNISTLKFLLELEKEKLSNKEYEQLSNKIIEEARIISNDSILSMMGVENSEKDTLSKKLIDESRLRGFLVQEIKNVVEETLSLYADSTVYIMSLEIDTNNYSCYLYVNTKENLAAKLQRVKGKNIWYYYFCENEWDVIEDSPKYFVKTTGYMREIEIEHRQIMQVYNIVAEAVVALQKENFFKEVYGNNIIFAFNAYDVCSKKEIIELFRKVNEEKDCIDYADNIDDFF